MTTQFVDTVTGKVYTLPTKRVKRIIEAKKKKKVKAR